MRSASTAPLVPQVAPAVVVRVAPQLVVGYLRSGPSLMFVNPGLLFASQLVRVLRSEFDSSSPTLVAVMFARWRGLAFRASAHVRQPQAHFVVRNDVLSGQVLSGEV